LSHCGLKEGKGRAGVLSMRREKLNGSNRSYFARREKTDRAESTAMEKGEGGVAGGGKNATHLGGDHWLLWRKGGRDQAEKKEGLL